MKGRRHTPEQVVRKLREADRLLVEGSDVEMVCRQLEISVQTYQRWRSQYKAMRPEDVVRLKRLEKENARLKRLWPRRSSTLTCSGRWLGETGEPGAAAQSGQASAEPFPGLGAQGVSDDVAASLRAALLPQPGVGRSATTRAAPAFVPASPTLRLPAHARDPAQRGLGV